MDLTKRRKILLPRIQAYDRLLTTYEHNGINPTNIDVIIQLRIGFGWHPTLASVIP